MVLSSDNSSATSSVEALAPYGRTLHNRERWTQSTVTRHARIFDVRHAVASRRVHSAGYYIHTPELPKSKPLCCTFVHPCALRLSSSRTHRSYARIRVRVRTRIVVNSRGMEESERFCISARPRKQGSYDWRSISRGRLELIQTFFPFAKRSHVYTGSTSSRLFTIVSKITESISSDLSATTNRVINGVIEIAEPGWALELFYERRAAVTGKKLVYTRCGCIYGFRWNSNYERGMENM